MTTRYDKEKLYNWTIYLIVSPSGRQYIGKTVNYKQRLRQYRHSKAKSQRVLNNSFIKYGIDNHKFEIIDTFEGNISCGNSKEMFWIRTYMSNINKFKDYRGMNLTDGGEGTMGHKFTKEQLKKLSDSHMGQPNWRKGQPLDQQTKDKISKTIKGTKYPPERNRRSFTQEEKDAVSNFMKGHTYSKGRKYGEDVIANMRKAMTNKHGLPVLHYGNNNIIVEYGSIAEAVRQTGISKKSIHTALRSKKPKYPFKFKDKVEFTKFTIQRRIFKQQEIKTA